MSIGGTQVRVDFMWSDVALWTGFALEYRAGCEPNVRVACHVHRHVTCHSMSCHM